MRADLGGTELYAPLQAMFKTASDPEYPRQVFVLSDGAVSNASQCISLTRIEARSTRVFT